MTATTDDDYEHLEVAESRVITLGRRELRLFPNPFYIGQADRKR
jgi:hypothetical protein